MTRDFIAERPTGAQKEARAEPPQPSFKPVALPALAAAIQASRTPPRAPRAKVLPAILRKNAELD